MINSSPSKNWKYILLQTAIPSLSAVIFFIIVFLFFPFREKIQFDTDEGLNLMRSMLVSLNHPLYTEVSSDQPPLFTHLLVLLFKITGFEVNPARILVLFFSTLLIWSCAQTIQIIWGNLAAALFMPLMLLAPRYIQLSASVMIGLPSISLACLSILFIVIWADTKSNRFIYFSGFFLALSGLIKLFTLFLIPIFLIYIIISIYFSSKTNFNFSNYVRQISIWTLSFSFVLFLIGVLLIGFQNLPQIIIPHVEAETNSSFQSNANTINYQLIPAIPLLLLGIFGIIFSVKHKKWIFSIIIGWAGAAYIVLFFHRPVFPHHQLLITVPIAMIAAAGIAEAVFSIIKLKNLRALINFFPIFGIITIISFFLVISIYYPAIDQQLSNNPRINGFSIRATKGKIDLIKQMNSYAKETNWILTDMPMYAFLVKRPVPPILATFSKKRLETGSISDADIIEALQKYNPEQVMLARFIIPVLESEINTKYTLVSSPEFFRLFIRNDLVHR